MNKQIVNDVHIGEIIRKVLKQKGITQSELARRIHCDRSKISKIISKKYIHTDLLVQISRAVEYNFFKHYSPL